MLAAAPAKKNADPKLLHKPLQYLLPKRRQCQLPRQVGSPVVFVDHGIHFDNLETHHASVISNDFHSQVSLAISSTAAHRSAHARRVLGIDPVHVERDVIAGGPASGHAQGLFHHSTHAALVNVAHGEDANAGATHVFLFNRIDVSHSHQHTVLRLHLGREI